MSDTVKPPTQAVMKTALDTYVERINAGDSDGVTALFTPDATIEDPVGTPIKRGPEIAAWFADTVAFETRIYPVGPARGSHGDEAALAFEVEFTPPTGPRLRIRSVDVCRFAPDGRISALRAYWGPDDVFAAQGQTGD